MYAPTRSERARETKRERERERERGREGERKRKAGDGRVARNGDVLDFITAIFSRPALDINITITLHS